MTFKLTLIAILLSSAWIWNDYKYYHKSVANTNDSTEDFIPSFNTSLKKSVLKPQPFYGLTKEELLKAQKAKIEPEKILQSSDQLILIGISITEENIWATVKEAGKDTLIKVRLNEAHMQHKLLKVHPNSVEFQNINSDKKYTLTLFKNKDAKIKK